MSYAEAIYGRSVGAGYTPEQQVAARASQVNAAMLSADTAVQNNKDLFSQTDYAQWNGIIVTYVKWYAGLQACLGDWVPPTFATSCTGYATTMGGFDLTSTQLDTYQATADTWQKKVATVNPSYIPPPPLPPITSPPTIGDQVKEAAQAIGVLALVGVGAFALYQGISIAASYYKAKKLAGI